MSEAYTIASSLHTWLAPILMVIFYKLKPHIVAWWRGSERRYPFDSREHTNLLLSNLCNAIDEHASQVHEDFVEIIAIQEKILAVQEKMLAVQEETLAIQEKRLAELEKSNNPRNTSPTKQVASRTGEAVNAQYSNP